MTTALAGPDADPATSPAPSVPVPTPRPAAVAYLCLEDDERTAEVRHRLADTAARHGRDLAAVFVDRPGCAESLQAMADYLRARRESCGAGLVVTPDLSHFAHVPWLAGATASTVGRSLGAEVLTVDDVTA